VSGTLIADIGGTNARFAWADGMGGHSPPLVLAVKDHPDLIAAARVAMAGRPAARALLALAGPVQGERCELTNSHWGVVEATAVGAACGIAQVTLLNDLAAQAALLPRLSSADVLPLGGGPGDAAAPRLLVAPGTGFGAALWVPGAGVVSTEAGHATLAAGNPQEAALLATLRERHGHASVESVLSGPGLAELRNLLGDAAEAMFLALLADHLGGMALTTGARGGVYLGGSILNARRAALHAPEFRARFLAKGRFAAWLEVAPLGLITLEQPGLAGLAWLAADRASDGASTATGPASRAPSAR
jgi:glucokinase